MTMIEEAVLLVIFGSWPVHHKSKTE